MQLVKCNIVDRCVSEPRSGDHAVNGEKGREGWELRKGGRSKVVGGREVKYSTGQTNKS